MDRQALVILGLVFIVIASVVMAEEVAPTPSHNAEAPKEGSSPSSAVKAPTTPSAAPKVSTPKAAAPTSSDATPTTSPPLSPKSSVAGAPESDSPSSDESLEDSPSGSPEEGPALAPEADAPTPTESTPADVVQSSPPKKNAAVTLDSSIVTGVVAVMAFSFY